MFCGFDVLRQKLEFHHIFHLTTVWGRAKYLILCWLSNPQLDPQNPNKCQHLTGQWICCFTSCVITCQVSFLYFCANYLRSHSFWDCSNPVLFCKSRQKRLESTGVLTGILCVSRRCMNWYECTVLALSLVLCQGNMFRFSFFSFLFFILCSAVAYFTKL